MIPALSDMFQDIKLVQRPTQDYRMCMDSGLISGKVQGVDAIAQSVYKRLYTQRYAHAIYSSDYGMEMQDLYGMPIDYVQAVLPGRITETLLQDSRIQNVTNFVFSRESTSLRAAFTVETNAGAIDAEYEVSLNV